MKLHKKRIVITGGTSGIGYEMVKYLHPDNEIIVISRSVEKLNELSQALEGISTYHADLSKLEEIEGVVESIDNICFVLITADGKIVFPIKEIVENQVTIIK